jgi:hypothetical protein
MWISELFERFAQQSPLTVMVRVLLEAALAPEALDVNLKKFASFSRGPKKPKPQPSNKKQPHVSTARLLAQAKRLR